MKRRSFFGVLGGILGGAALSTLPKGAETAPVEPPIPQHPDEECLGNAVRLPRGVEVKTIRGPYCLDPGDTLTVHIDGGCEEVTFNSGYQTHEQIVQAMNRQLSGASVQFSGDGQVVITADEDCSSIIEDRSPK